MHRCVCVEEEKGHGLILHAHLFSLCVLANANNLNSGVGTGHSKEIRSSSPYISLKAKAQFIFCSTLPQFPF